MCVCVGSLLVESWDRKTLITRRGSLTGSFHQKEGSSMEISSIRGLSELGMEDPSFIQQWQIMNSLDDQLSILPLAAAFGENLQQSFFHQNFNLKTSMEASPMSLSRPTKHPKTSSSWNSCRSEYISNPVLSFVDSDCMNQMGLVKPKEEAVCSKSIPSNTFTSQENYEFKACEGAKKVNTNSRFSQAQDHIMAERKRREKLSQRFIALSAIVPGLKKTDKASVLGDTIKYLKQMQEKVKTLEEQTRTKTMESVIFVKKSQVFANGDNSSSDEELPEIEARVCDKNILIRIQCVKMKGVLEKTVAEIEKLHLTVVNSSVLTFGDAALHITIMAQMNEEFCTSVKDLVKNLHSAFKLFM